LSLQCVSGENAGPSVPEEIALNDSRGAHEPRRAQKSLRALRARMISVVACAALAGCAIGPRALQESRLQYNEVIKATTEQQLLLNIVRLRYTDTPSSLAVANIAAQFELVKNLQITPFFTAAGGDINRSFTSILPQAGIAYADRPTLSLVPIDDTEFTRKLFTPLTLDGVVYLVRTTWPIATVFRLYLENLNWVPNAELASGPTPRNAPVFADFLRGVTALQELQNRGQMVLQVEERTETVGGPVPASQVNAASVIEAAKSGLELKPDPDGRTWRLTRKTRQPVLRIDPRALDAPETREFVRVFMLKPGAAKYEVVVDTVDPFETRAAGDGLTVIDLETRSLLQALYFVSHGVEIPPDHLAAGRVRRTVDENGEPFDWRRITDGLFRVQWSAGETPPANAHVAIFYQGYWFYVDATDHDTKATFSLLVELSRLELQAKTGEGGPVLTLPLGR